MCLIALSVIFLSSSTSKSNLFIISKHVCTQPNSTIFSPLSIVSIHLIIALSLPLTLQVILAEIYSTGFQRSFFDEDDLTSIAENDIIYAFQASPLYIRGGSARISGNSRNLCMHTVLKVYLISYQERVTGSVTNSFLI